MELEGVDVEMEVDALNSGRWEDGRESWFSRVESREW